MILFCCRRVPELDCFINAFKMFIFTTINNKSMDTIKLYNALENFDFHLLDNPDFKEDSVREEIILPIIKGLGYTANKPHQIIRSKKLLHPFVSIGSQRRNISVIPDYLFKINDKPAWILDAKAPNEPIIKSFHVEQAYSYAIHPEVRVKFYALCNGREFALYNIEEIIPIRHFSMDKLPVHWPDLVRMLAPENVFNYKPHCLYKDLGLHLKRLGFREKDVFVFPNVPVTNITQLYPDKFTITENAVLDDDEYAASFDFGQDVFMQLIGKIPMEYIGCLSKRTEKQQSVQFAREAFLINIECNLGNNMEENPQEIFQPLWIKRLL